MEKLERGGGWGGGEHDKSTQFIFNEFGSTC